MKKIIGRNVDTQENSDQADDGFGTSVGVLPDGRIVCTRSKSKDGKPTTEIYDKVTKKVVKIKYDQ